MTEQHSAPTSATQQPSALEIQVVQRTDVGRVRTENQDFATATTPEEAASLGHLMVVADGMGGHRGGATASRIAGTTIKTDFMEQNTSDVPVLLRTALEDANARIFAEAQSNPDLRGMGTTCSALVIRGGFAWFGHVGDSRIYLVRDGQIQPLTQDHSLVASMVREGLLTPEEAEVHPRRNVLQRSMGVAGEVEVDVSEPLQIQPGDRFILCSDGLHGLVKDHEIRDIVMNLDVQDAADEFIQRALDRGAHDNVTVIVASVEEPSPASALLSATTETGETTFVAPAGPARKKKARRGGGMLLWLIIALLVFGVTGAAILYWNEGSILTLIERIGH